MRLEVFCEDRLGLTRELLDLLVLRSIDLRGIEIDPVGRIYLNFAEIEFNTFSSLMAEIRRIAGVTDVRTIPWMPSEREHLALSALLEAMPEPFLSLDLKNKVERVNQASCQLFAQSSGKTYRAPRHATDHRVLISSAGWTATRKIPIASMSLSTDRIS